MAKQQIITPDTPEFERLMAESAAGDLVNSWKELRDIVAHGHLPQSTIKRVEMSNRPEVDVELHSHRPDTILIRLPGLVLFAVVEALVANDEGRGQ